MSEPHLQPEREDWDLAHAWSPPGKRGMRLKNRETFVPGRYVRKWEEGNEEMMLRALKRFKSLKVRVIFQVEEDKEDVARRTNKNRLSGDRKVKWTPLKGKTLQIKKIPSIGMVWQLVKAMQDAAVETANK